MASEQEWKKKFVAHVRQQTGCTHEQAFFVLGRVIELRESSYQSGFGRGLQKEETRIRADERKRVLEEMYGKEWPVLYEEYEAMNRKRETDRDISIGFKDAVEPLIEWMNNNCNPHMKIIVESTGAELVSGERSHQTMEFVRD